MKAVVNAAVPRCDRALSLYGTDYFFFQAEDGIRDDLVTGVQTCALPIYTGHTQEVLTVPCYPRLRKLIGYYYGSMQQSELPGYVLYTWSYSAGRQDSRVERCGRAKPMPILSHLVTRTGLLPLHYARGRCILCRWMYCVVVLYMCLMTCCCVV